MKDNFIEGGAGPRGVSSLFSWRGENGNQIMPKKVAKKNANADGNLFKTTAPAVEKTSDEDDVKTAVKCLLETHRASTSHFQRWMGWGYNHAAHVIDLLTDRGIVAPPNSLGPRQILKSSAELKKLLKGNEKEKSV